MIKDIVNKVYGVANRFFVAAEYIFVVKKFKIDYLESVSVRACVRVCLPHKLFLGNH